MVIVESHASVQEVETHKNGKQLRCLERSQPVGHCIKVQHIQWHVYHTASLHAMC